jgi:hypothetical protein
VEWARQKKTLEPSVSSKRGTKKMVKNFETVPQHLDKDVRERNWLQHQAQMREAEGNGREREIKKELRGIVFPDPPRDPARPCLGAKRC